MNNKISWVVSVVLVSYKDDGKVNILNCLRNVEAVSRHEAVGNVIEAVLKENPEHLLHCYTTMELQSDSQLTQNETYEALAMLMEKIEAAGASPELTDAVVIASDLRASIGNRWNPSSPERAKLIRDKMKTRTLISIGKL